jgi:hypothetical protein
MNYDKTTLWSVNSAEDLKTTNLTEGQEMKRKSGRRSNSNQFKYARLTPKNYVIARRTFLARFKQKIGTPLKNEGTDLMSNVKR